MVLSLSTSSDSVLYLYQVLSKYLIEFLVTDLNSRVDSRVVAYVDRHTDGQTGGKPDPYIAPCLRQVQQKRVRKIINDGVEALTRKSQAFSQII